MHRTMPRISEQLKFSNLLITLNISNFFVFKYFLNRKKVLKSWESNSFIYRGNVVVSVHHRTKKYIPSWTNFTKIQISHLHHRIRYTYIKFSDNRGFECCFHGARCKKHQKWSLWVETLMAKKIWSKNIAGRENTNTFSVWTRKFLDFSLLNSHIVDFKIDFLEKSEKVSKK